MLILTRRIGEILNIGDDITLCVISATDDQVRLGICAPREIVVDRLEVRERKLRDLRRNLETTSAKKSMLEKDVL